MQVWRAEQLAACSRSIKPYRRSPRFEGYVWRYVARGRPENAVQISRLRRNSIPTRGATTVTVWSRPH